MANTPESTGSVGPVPFFDLKQQLAAIRDEIRGALDDVLDDGGFANGRAVARFEQEFAAHCGTSHCVAVNTGTSFLHLAVCCLDVGPGDEVITVSMSFIATAWPILYVGATPVLVDVDPVRCTMDPARLEAAITPKTRAIVVVHLYGQCAEMDRILAIAKEHDIPVIEDCAQAVGATHRRSVAGTLGVVGCFSFYPSKNLGAYGEGGAMITDDPMIAARCRRLRDHAQVQRYCHDETGYNYRLNSFQGAILSVKLKHLEAWTEARIRLARRYDRLLPGTSIVPPSPCPDGRHVYHLYVGRHQNRDTLRKALDEKGIGTAVHYPMPIHLQTPFRRMGFKEGDLPVTEEIARTCVSLPLYPEMPDDHQDRAVAAIQSLGPGS